MNKDDAIACMKKVMDPEIGLDVWTLGLIYEVNVDGSTADIKMTFTSPTCPFGPQIVKEVKVKLQEKGFSTTNVEVVFTPPWEPSNEVKSILGI